MLNVAKYLAAICEKSAYSNGFASSTASLSCTSISTMTPNAICAIATYNLYSVPFQIHYTLSQNHYHDSENT